MKDKIVAFAALKVFYESGHDLLDVFANLILLAITPEKERSIKDIRETLNEHMQYDIPTDVIRTLLKRLSKSDFVSYRNVRDVRFKSITLTEKGVARKSDVRKNYDEAKREKRAILKQLNNRDLQYTEEELRKELDQFIENSTKQAIFTLEKDNTISGGTLSQAQADVCSFFAEAERSDPATYERLKAFLYGQVLSRAFLNRQFDSSAKASDLTVYLDTNIVISLLGFHEDGHNLAATETLDLAKESGVELKIFSSTLEEIKRVLRVYLEDHAYYTEKIPVQSIYYVLKTKGYSRIDMMALIESLEKRLADLGVEIDYSFDVEELVRDEGALISKLIQYKPVSGKKSLWHDLAAIKAVRSIRGNKKPYQWEKSKAIFLTGDVHLASYNFNELGHKKAKSFPEAIFRANMASLFWLKGKSGSDNAFLHNLFASHMRGDMVDGGVWEQFVREVKRKREDGNLTYDQIDTIMSLAETERLLREEGVRAIDKVLDDKRIELVRREASEKDRELIDNEKTISSQSKKIEEIQNALETSAKRFWSLVVNITTWAIASILAIVFLASIFIFGLPVVADVMQALGIVFIFALAHSVTTGKQVRLNRWLISFKKNVQSGLVAKSIERKRKRYNI